MPTAIDLSQIPAAPAPPGMTSNLIDPPTLWPTTIALCSCVLVLTVPSVLVRLFTKWRILKEVNWEDYVLILAECSLINWMGILLGQHTKGAHLWDTSLAGVSQMLYWSNLLIILYCPGILLAKWTVVLQIERVFFIQRGTVPWYLSQGVIWASTLFYVIVGFCDVFQCTPRVKIWEPQTPGTCLSINAILVTTCFFNIVTDAIIVMIPLLVVKKLNMSKKRKLIASVVFGVAALALVSAILRAIYTFIFISSMDVTYNLFPVGYWAGAEMAFIIFATSFPTFPRFYEWCRGRDDRFRAGNTAPDTFQRRPSTTLTNDSAWGQIKEQSPMELKPREWPSASTLASSNNNNNRQSHGGIVKVVDFGVTSEPR